MCNLLLLLSCLTCVLSVSVTPTVVDLSHPYDDNTINWPTGTPFRFTNINAQSSPFWYAMNDFETTEHAGTHLDAPYHFNRQGWHLGEIPLEKFFGKAVVVDLRDKAALNPDYLVTAQDFEEWERLHGPVPEGSIVLLDFGWASKYHSRSEYFGTDDVNNTSSFHFPGLSENGAQWLAKTGRVHGVGTDTASIDYGQTKDFLAHRVMAANNMFNLEHVALPATPLPPKGFQVLALPMKLQKGTGAPVRIVAVLPAIDLENGACVINN